MPLPVEDYAYDARGNRITRTSRATGAVETYSYDSQNRLIGYSDGATVASYAYDTLGRRIAKVVDGVATAYVHDKSADDPLAHDDIVLEYSDSLLTRRWLHSNSVDEPVGFEEYTSTSGVGSGTERTMFADRQGSVIWVTAPATGSVVAAYEYDGYGAITQTQGALVQPFGYNGREYDSESGLYHNRMRSYDPSNGSFLQADPIDFESQTHNIYSYAGNSPFNFDDPLGLVSTRAFVDQIPSGIARTTGLSTPIMAETITLAGSIAGLLHSYRMGSDATKFVQTTAPGNTGFCSPALHSALQAAVDATRGGVCQIVKYKQWGTATGNAIRVANLRIQAKIAAHAIARATINATCYGGGNAGHKKAMRDTYKGLAWCTKTITGPNPKRNP